MRRRVARSDGPAVRVDRALGVPDERDGIVDGCRGGGVVVGLDVRGQGQRLLPLDGHPVSAGWRRRSLRRVPARDAQEIPARLERDTGRDPGHVGGRVRIDTHELTGVDGEHSRPDRMSKTWTLVMVVGMPTTVRRQVMSASTGWTSQRTRSWSRSSGSVPVRAHRAGHDRRVLGLVVGLCLRDACRRRSRQGARCRRYRGTRSRRRRGWVGRAGRHGARDHGATRQEQRHEHAAQGSRDR